MTNGSQDGLSKAFDMLLEDGDSVLVEDPTYSGSLASIKPHNDAILVEMPTDANGIIPERLAYLLQNWDHRNSRFPKIMYTIPTGQNPSGSTIPDDRKREIYRIACQYDLLILEDDPYFFLAFQDEHPVSFFSLDVEQRVLRFDSLSKVLSSGLRIGFTSGPKPLIEQLHLHVQSSLMHCSGVSQMIVLSLLQKWGHDGFQHHILKNKQFYREKRDLFLNLASKHLKGLAEWTVPSAGMFVWFKLLGVPDSRLLIEGKAREKKVILVPGQYFQPNNKPGPFVRASYSIATAEHMDVALSRLASVLRDAASS